MAEATDDLGGNKIPNKSISVKKHQIASECSEQPIVKQATNEVKNQTEETQQFCVLSQKNTVKCC